MRLINTNLLNYFYKNGVKPLKDSLTKKLDASKGANNLLTTEPGFWLDARQGTELKRLIDGQNSNLSELNGSLENLFTVVSGSAESDSIAAADITTIKITFPVPDNYEIHSVKDWYITGWAGLLPQGYTIANNTITFHVYNIHNTSMPCKIVLRVYCIKK